MSSRWRDQGVGPQGPDGLVFEAGGEVLAVGVVVGLGALDDAPRMAALLGLAAPGLDQLGHALAADVLGKLEAAAPEILGGQRPGLVDDVDQDRGAERRQGLAAHRVVQEVLGPEPGGGLEFLGVGQGHGRRALVIHHQGLELLGAHQGPQAAPARGRGPAGRWGRRSGWWRR